jgi:hypothetical protein
MTHTSQRPAPSRYQLLVDGHLDQHWSSWFADFTVTPEDDGTTRLTGAVADQAELHGLLARIRDLGLTLLSVEVLDLRTSRAARPSGAPS